MRSRITLAVVTATMAAAVCFASVSAAPNGNSKFRNCPVNWSLDLQSNWGLFSDHNDDGLVCTKYSPLPAPAIPGDYIIIDNTAH